MGRFCGIITLLSENRNEKQTQPSTEPTFIYDTNITIIFKYAKINLRKLPLWRNLRDLNMYNITGTIKSLRSTTQAMQPHAIRYKYPVHTFNATFRLQTLLSMKKKTTSSLWLYLANRCFEESVWTDFLIYVNISQLGNYCKCASE